MITMRAAIAFAIAMAPTVTAQTPDRAAGGGDRAAADTSVRLLTGLGRLHVPVTTAKPLAQRYFDQGMRLTYAFNHAEAVRAFEAAELIDPACAMCAWGAALARGPNINAPAVDSATEVAARAAIDRAMSRRSRASRRERALIEALDTRHAVGGSRAQLDSAWARAMGSVAQKYPNDPDVQVLHAEALMTLSPWNYWTQELAPRPDTRMILSRLERTLRRTPGHPGACHYYIHAVEAAQPGKALACSERLAANMPAAGHIVHMPAHIYIRLGRYADAIEANRHATHTDERYLQDQPSARATTYGIGYYPHNYHFLSFVAYLAGNADLALRSARETAERLHPQIAPIDPALSIITPIHHVMLANFGRWDELLALAIPDSTNPTGRGVAQFAHGLALAATNQIAAADAALAAMVHTAPTVAPGDPRTVMAIAEHALRGEIAFHRGDLAAAERSLREAMVIEDAMLYVEPPVWYYPIRHQLGRVLLDGGKAADAERVYREDLARFPDNVWSLTGLHRALIAQAKRRDADLLLPRLATARAGADLAIERSRF